jgi:hypothetical protein
LVGPSFGGSFCDTSPTEFFAFITTSFAIEAGSSKAVVAITIPPAKLANTSTVLPNVLRTFPRRPFQVMQLHNIMKLKPIAVYR